MHVQRPRREPHLPTTHKFTTTLGTRNSKVIQVQAEKRRMLGEERR